MQPFLSSSYVVPVWIVQSDLVELRDLRSIGQYVDDIVLDETLLYYVVEAIFCSRKRYANHLRKLGKLPPSILLQLLQNQEIVLVETYLFHHYLTCLLRVLLVRCKFQPRLPFKLPCLFLRVVVLEVRYFGAEVSEPEDPVARSYSRRDQLI